MSEAPSTFAPPEALANMGATPAEAYANPDMQLTNFDRAKALHNVDAGMDLVESLTNEKLQQDINEADSKLTEAEKKQLEQHRVYGAAVLKTEFEVVKVPTTAEDQARINAAAERGPSAYEKIQAENAAQSANIEQQLARNKAGESWANIQTPAKAAEVR